MYQNPLFRGKVYHFMCETGTWRGVGTFGSGTYAKQHEMGGCFWQKRKSAFGTFRDQNLVFLGLGDIRLLGQKTARTKDYPDIRPPGHITTMSNTKRQYVTKIWF